MNRLRRLSAIPIAAAFLVLPALSSSAHQPQGESSSKPASPPSRKPPAKNNAPSESTPDQPKWDPLRAEKDLEVGKYYMKAGKLDAAIDRFMDAIDARPGYAIPFRYLAEAQEKKGLKKDAIKSYTKYLDLYPHAEDSAKVKRKIEKLWSEVEKVDRDEKKSAS